MWLYGTFYFIFSVSVCKWTYIRNRPANLCLFHVSDLCTKTAIQGRKHSILNNNIIICLVEYNFFCMFPVAIESCYLAALCCADRAKMLMGKKRLLSQGQPTVLRKHYQCRCCDDIWLFFSFFGRAIDVLKVAFYNNSLNHTTTRAVLKLTTFLFTDLWWYGKFTRRLFTTHAPGHCSSL